jgi:hypothetical protein
MLSYAPAATMKYVWIFGRLPLPTNHVMAPRELCFHTSCRSALAPIGRGQTLNQAPGKNSGGKNVT